MSGWMQVGVDHECTPNDWSTYPGGSIYHCPRCTNVYRTKGDAERSWLIEREHGAGELLRMMSSPLAMMFYAVLIATVFVGLVVS